MKFGGIEREGLFGGMTLINLPATKMPQELASAFGNCNMNLLGATFNPIWWLGKQLVNGTNYHLICEEIRVTKETKPQIVVMTINVPPGSVGGDGAKIVKITEKDVPDEIEGVFSSVMSCLVGCSYRPVAYVGKQIVKGTNHYIIAEAKMVVPNSKPYAVMVCINEFEKQTRLVSIEVISDESKFSNSPLGEWP